MEGKLVIFCAPSGSGKSTIVQHLVRQDLGLAFSISATSRQARKGELDGREYYFLSAEQFRKKIDAGEFIEWEEVYTDHFYGTLHSEVEGIWKNDQHAIFDIDVAGAMNLKQIYKSRALSVFVKPPSISILEKRLRKRGSDDESSLKKRLGKAEYELKFAPRFDVILVNDDLESTLAEAEKLVKNFLSGS